ncbi:outer membrane lipoprotein carrier protein LolA [Planctomycetota bacterium]
MDAEQERIERLAQQMSVELPPALDERIQREADAQFETFKQPACPSWAQRIGRIIMKSHIVRIAAVFAVIAAVAFFHQTGDVAWALEESIAALSHYRAVLLEGQESERTWSEDGSKQRRPSKYWAVANADQTGIEKFRAEAAGALILTTDGRKTWRYDPDANVVYVENRPYTASDMWWGAQFFEQMQTWRDKGIFTQWNVTYSRDAATARERAVLTCAMPDGPPSPRSLEITFDVESKLPISLKQWENPTWEGPADLVIEKITYYETLSDDLFEMEIPEGAQVIEE